MKEMPAAAVAEIEVHAVCRLQAVHEFAEIARRRLDHQMNVIGHQAEHVKANLVGFDAVGQAITETLAVAVVAKDVPPVVPTNGNRDRWRLHIELATVWP